MKRQLIYFTLWLITLTIPAVLDAQSRPSSGLVLRGSYWDATRGKGIISVRDDGRRSHIDLNGVGGSVGYFTRLNDQVQIEFSISSIADGSSDTFAGGREIVNAKVVVPVLLGLRAYLLPASSRSGLQPYLSGGAGAYWLGDIQSEDHGYFRNEETVLYSNTRSGGYLGGGTNLHISRNFAFNFDARYHMVDFKDDSFQNGWEGGIGISLMWGRR